MILTTGSFVVAWLSLVLGVLMLILGFKDEDIFTSASCLGLLGYGIFIGTLAEISKSLRKQL